MTRQLGSAYVLDEPIGRGAMGEVWRGRVLETGEPIAAKLLRDEYTSDREVLTRFVQERSILVSLRHPNLVQVVDLVVEGTDLAIIMELVEGKDLRQHLDDQKRLAPAEAVRLTAEVLDALAVAHAARVLHRDIKPDNVLVDRSGDELRARLSDFGIARLAEGTAVRMSQLIGTPEYLAPEVVSTEVVTAAADVYGCGILLYELLAGRTPFGGKGAAYAIIRRQVDAAPPPIEGLPPVVWTVLEHLLAKDPAARPDSVAAATMLRGLLPGLAGVPPMAEQPAVADWQKALGPAVAAGDDGGTIIRGAAGADVLEELAEAPVWVPEADPGIDDRGTRVHDRPLLPRAPGPTIVEEPPVAPANPQKNRRNMIIAAVGMVAIVAVVAIVLSRGSGDGGEGGTTTTLPSGGIVAQQAGPQDLGLVDIERTYELVAPPEGAEGPASIQGTVTYRAGAGLPVRGQVVREYVPQSLIDLSGTGALSWEEPGVEAISTGAYSLPLPDLEDGDGGTTFTFTIDDVSFDDGDGEPLDPQETLDEALDEAQRALGGAVDAVPSTGQIETDLRALAIRGAELRVDRGVVGSGETFDYRTFALYGTGDEPNRQPLEPLLPSLASDSSPDPLEVSIDGPCQKVGPGQIKAGDQNSQCTMTPRLGSLPERIPASVQIAAGGLGG